MRCSKSSFLHSAMRLKSGHNDSSQGRVQAERQRCLTSAGFRTTERGSRVRFCRAATTRSCCRTRPCTSTTATDRFATCNFDASQALCLGEGDSDSAPVVTECQAQCPSLLRTDADVERIAEEIQSIDGQIASPVVPEPLKKRLRQVRSRLVQIIAAHERDRIVPSRTVE